MNNSMVNQYVCRDKWIMVIGAVVHLFLTLFLLGLFLYLLSADLILVCFSHETLLHSYTILYSYATVTDFVHVCLYIHVSGNKVTVRHTCTCSTKIIQSTQCTIDRISCVLYLCTRNDCVELVSQSNISKPYCEC